MAHYKAEQDDWLIVYLKYLLFVFNFFFWVGGAAVMAVGVWTLVEKSGYLSVLASSTFAASAYILIFAGALVMVTGFLGFGAIIREDRSCLSTYFCLLLVIFLVELVAGVLAHMYYQRLSDELKQHLSRTLAENYRQPGASDLTTSVDRLQQDFKCCGSNSSADWQHSAYILSREAEGRRVPDSCCKTVVARCGQRAHPSNIYKVEGGCITKLEQFLADHLLLMGAVGIGVACLQPRVHQGSLSSPEKMKENAWGPGGPLELVRDREECECGLRPSASRTELSSCCWGLRKGLLCAPAPGSTEVSRNLLSASGVRDPLSMDTEQAWATLSIPFFLISPALGACGS
ncbi:tetraspanin-11 isoform X3 [Zalophus californianus]|uniref:Tetraspanin-11 isoform X3 n=1 Tax=Zalophus californianus TaxID=9704 RepID=A0A6P9EVX8_ZALCA|nr:tetraspanin-11 isoform X3 [Zalophus californianus]